ncbi:Putative AC9 transposase, partial [Linum grandiflorum]
DLLVIPITSVASESAFSSGGRLLDPHRSRLNSTTVEALMCTRSWIMDEANLTKGGKAVELEGVFSALALEDASVEENIGKQILEFTFQLWNSHFY